MTGPALLHELLDAAAADQPDRPAVRRGDDALTYRGLREASLRLAAWLGRIGVRRGDRVVVALPVDVVLPALLYACSRVGAAFVVLRDEVPASLLGHVLDDAEPIVLFSNEGAAEPARVRTFSLDDVRAIARDHPMHPRPPAPLAIDPVCLIYTSGSTGMPKAVVCLHAQVTFAAEAIQSQLGYASDDVVFCALPLAFDYGLYQTFLCALARAELHLASSAEAGPQLLVALTRAGATVLPAVPSLAANLARLLSRPPNATNPTATNPTATNPTATSPPATSPPAPALRLLTNTGAAMPPSVLAELRRRMPGLRVQLMFGLTECKRATIMGKDEDLHRPGACGRALPGTEVFAVDESGARVPAGTVGELVIRGPHVMAGYWRHPDLTAQRFRRVDGLFPQLRTGDYGWLDEEGYLYFEGRRDDVYKERGFRVSTIEVEAAANKIPGVEAAAVIPPSVDDDGATLLVVGSFSPDEILRQLRRHLEDVKIPARCVVVPRLPLTPNGKVDRHRLPALALPQAGG